MEYCSLTYNGQLIDSLIDGYVTANVDGRGILNRELDAVDVPSRDGTVIIGQRIEPRIITVYYILKAPNAKVFLERLTELHGILNVDKDVAVKFGDEDYIRYGRLHTAENPPYDQVQGVGSFEIICQDPYKYSDAAVMTATGAITFTPDGKTESLRPTIQITLAGSASKINLLNVSTGKRIILNGTYSTGDVIVIDATKDIITRNGGSSKQHLDFVESDFFHFVVSSGDQISVTPSTATIQLTYRRRLL